MSFNQWAKTPHASQIGCRVAPSRNHWACLTTAKCPCLGLYAREVSGFLSPLLLLLLPFTYSSAAPNHFAKRLIGMQWKQSPPPSCSPDQFKTVTRHTHCSESCYTLQRTSTHCITVGGQTAHALLRELQHTATHCYTLQHAATHCNTLQHTATHCNILPHTRP